MSVFVTDKRIETLNYDLICTRKDLKEMTLLVQTNSTTIADLLGLIREQKKSLTELRREVDSLKTELSALKKGSGVSDQVDQSEVTLESKSTVEEEIEPEIKPEDKPFRHFEFDKSWEDFPTVKKWGESNVIYGVVFNVIPRFPQGTLNYSQFITPKFIGIDSETRKKIPTPGFNIIEFEEPKSIKNTVLIVEKFFQEKIDKYYGTKILPLVDTNFQNYRAWPHGEMLTFLEYLSKDTVKGHFLCCNKIQSLYTDSKNSMLNIDIYS